MTLGQHIAQKRRELGLSQEQLGQEMGVSRQAIYKWESDAAVPEIDKLIALSDGQLWPRAALFRPDLDL